MRSVSQEFWDKDVNRLTQGKELRLSLQHLYHNLSRQEVDDKSHDPLFEWVSAEALQRGDTIPAFRKLLNHTYNPEKNKAEGNMSWIEHEEKQFLATILKTEVMKALRNYLNCTRKISSTTEFQALMNKLWFERYSRSENGAVNDTSGFEHVMVGEFKNSKKVNGFHNWLSFYFHELNPARTSFNYYGYTAKKDMDGHPFVLDVMFEWQQRIKNPPSSFFVATSPEFDIAVYSLCAVTHSGRDCPLQINNVQLVVETHQKEGHIATAYVVAESR